MRGGMKRAMRLGSSSCCCSDGLERGMDNNVRGNGSSFEVGVERVYQGRGAMSRRIQRRGGGQGGEGMLMVMMRGIFRGQAGGCLSYYCCLLLVMLYCILSFGCTSLVAAREVFQPVNLAVVSGVNLSSYDEAIQQAAYSAFTKQNPGTGKVFGANLTGDLSNVTVQAVRLRVGSFNRYGATLGRFTIPPGVKVLDVSFVRVIVVYRDYGNVSVYTSPVSGQIVVSPVVGIRVYDGDTLGNTSPLPPLNTSVLREPITVLIPANANPSQCVAFFNEGNNSTVTNVTTNGSAGNATYSCSTRSFEDFALVGLPPPKKKSNTWKIIVGTVVGVVGLILILLCCVCCMRRGLRRRRMARMQQQVDQGETLEPHLIGTSRAPAATETRTRPSLEKDYLES